MRKAGPRGPALSVFLGPLADLHALMHDHNLLGRDRTGVVRIEYAQLVRCDLNVLELDLEVGLLAGVAIAVGGTAGSGVARPEVVGAGQDAGGRRGEHESGKWRRE